MATLVIKSFPEELHARLKRAAAAHRRSVTQETIYLIDRALSQDTRPTPPTKTPYWADRTLVPEFAEALQQGAFSGGTESSRIVSDERNER